VANGFVSAISDASAASDPYSFKAITPPWDAGTSSCEGARIHHPLPDGWTKLHVEFQIARNTGIPVSSGVIDFVSIDCQDTNGTTTAYGMVKWGLHASGNELVVSGTPALEGGTLATGGFTHVALDVTYGMGGTAGLTVDDAGVATTPMIDMTCASGHTALSFGAFACNSATPACTAYIDNVLVTYN
jgi:hypothetical protein